MLTRGLCSALNRRCISSAQLRYYRMPTNLLTFLERITADHNPSKSLSVVESYKVLKEKISEHEELQTFINTTQDKELKELAVLDIEEVSTDIDNIVESVRDELGGLSQVTT